MAQFKVKRNEGLLWTRRTRTLKNRAASTAAERKHEAESEEYKIKCDCLGNYLHWNEKFTKEYKYFTFYFMMEALRKEPLQYYQILHYHSICMQYKKISKIFYTFFFLVTKSPKSMCILYLQQISTWTIHISNAQ